MTTHLEQSLQRDINLIVEKVLEMAQRAEHALKLCLQALHGPNRQLAYSVILQDTHIDELEKQIDRLCLEFIVRQQPVAGNLRFVYAAIKINTELERIGDYAENIARHLLLIDNSESRPYCDRFAEIANMSIPMVHDAVQSFVRQDARLARETSLVEDRVDNVCHAIISEFLRAGHQGRIPVEDLIPLMMIARRFERVSDQARNICEEVLYMCTGEYMKHKGTEVFRILFVDDDNSCISQMAEGIGNSLNISELYFSSAGVDPRPVDLRAIGFLAGKGIDISRHVSKSLEQIPNLEHYQVIVGLTERAGFAAFPPAPTKAVALSWNVPNPAGMGGREEEIVAAYEKTCKYLDENIRDLAKAILGEGKAKGEEKDAES